MCTDYDPPSFWSERWVEHARKEHRCIECARTIEEGERYWRCFGVNGDTYGGPTCAHCQTAREFLLVACGGRFMVEGLSEELWEHADEFSGWRGGWALDVLGSLMARRWIDKKTGRRVTLKRISGLVKVALTSVDEAA